MNVLHLTDLHLTEGPALASQRETLLKLVRTPGVDLALITGDLYGKAVPHRSTPRERAVMLEALAILWARCPVVIVRGNHDHREDLQGLKHVSGLHPVHVVDRPEILTVEAANGRTARVYCLPYPQKAWLVGAGVSTVRETQQTAEQALDQLMTLWASRLLRDRKRRPELYHLAAFHIQIGGSVTSGGEVLAGQEIELSGEQISRLHVDYGALGHLHKRQEMAPRWYYGGSAWPTDFGERDDKTVNVAELYDDNDDYQAAATAIHHTGQNGGTYPQGERHGLVIRLIDAAEWRAVTLDFVWGEVSSPAGPAAGWIKRPKTADLARVPGSMVRARLTTTTEWAAACPWSEVLERLEAEGPIHLKAERVLIPVQRVRAPEVAEAVGLADKLASYWQTLEAPPSDTEQTAAADMLELLQHHDDQEIAEALAERLQVSKGGA